ncbi:MAG: hypothetical protein WCQ45_03730 [bacterium]
MQRRLFVVGVVILCLACLVTACTKQDRAAADRAQRVDKLQAAYDAVAAVESATKAGVPYTDYAQRVPSASTALMAYEPEDDEAREVASHLAAAVYAYQTAMRAWGTKFDECEDCAWRKFRSVHPEFAMEDADADYAIGVLWNAAAVEMEAAREGLAAYKRR